MAFFLSKICRGNALATGIFSYPVLPRSSRCRIIKLFLQDTNGQIDMYKAKYREVDNQTDRLVTEPD